MIGCNQLWGWHGGSGFSLNSRFCLSGDQGGRGGHGAHFCRTRRARVPERVLCARARPWASYKGEEASWKISTVGHLRLGV